MARRKKKGGAYKPEHGKAGRIRVKLRSGAEVSVDELEWLKSYEASKMSPGRPIAAGGGVPSETAESDEDTDVEEGDTEDPEEPEAPESPTPEATPPVEPQTAAPPPPIGRPPKIGRPPRVRLDERDDKSGNADWRAKYKADAKTGGREATVTKIADAWCGVLQVLADQIRASGADPIVDPTMLRGAIVLTVDDLLPAHIQIEPQHMAAAGSTALLVQRFMRRKQIAEVYAKQNETEEYRKRNEARREEAARAQKESEDARAASPVVPPSVDSAPAPAAEPDAVAPRGPVNGAAKPTHPYAGMSAHDILTADPTAVL
jgi:hypothetical protein